MAGGQSGQGVSVSNQLEFSNQPTLMDVAKYSPSGFYIASGDKSGKVRIWDTVNKEHILKNEFQPSSNTAAVYAGPPFKYKGTKTDHSRRW